MNKKQEYVPGVCNIGPAEIESRRRAGWLGLFATILIWIGFIIFKVSAPWRLFLFIPATMSAVGFLQAAMHFCAAFGVLGVFNFGSQVGKAESVQQAEYRKADQKKALLIMFYSLIIGIVVGIIGFLITIT